MPLPRSSLAARTRHRWAILSAAPHRLFFLTGSVQLVAAMLYWLAVVVGLYTGAWRAPATTLPPVAAHSFLMLYGLFPFFIFGFLDTSFPHWMDQGPLSKRAYLAPWLLMSAGMAAFYAGLFTQRPVLVAGVAVYAAGIAVNLLVLAARLLRSTSARKWQVIPVLGGLAGGALGGACYGVWLAGGSGAWLQASINAGMWLFLVPLVVAVGFRLIPFFSSRKLPGYTPVKPAWALPLIGLLLAARFALLSAGATHWLLLCDLPLAVAGAALSVQWRSWRSLRVPLLGMLHVSFAWFALGMALYSVSDALALAEAPGLGLGPLHAIGIGLIGGMLIAMASRVSLGHSGRTLVADGLTRWAFAAIQIAAVSRVIASVPSCLSGVYPTLVIVAVIAWLAATMPWLARFGTIYLRPRADGRPG